LELIKTDINAVNIPEYINYIPIDLSTLLWSKYMDPDMSRKQLAMMADSTQHNALEDAKVIKKCFDRLRYV
jgi:hypothetical protein